MIKLTNTGEWKIRLIKDCFLLKIVTQRKQLDYNVSNKYLLRNAIYK